MKLNPWSSFLRGHWSLRAGRARASSISLMPEETVTDNDFSPLIAIGGTAAKDALEAKTISLLRLIRNSNTKSEFYRICNRKNSKMDDDTVGTKLIGLYKEYDKVTINSWDKQKFYTPTHTHTHTHTYSHTYIQAYTTDTHIEGAVCKLSSSWIINFAYALYRFQILFTLFETNVRPPDFPNFKIFWRAVE